MKFIDSLTEDRIRKRLISSKRWLFDTEEGKRIISFLEEAIGKINSAYLLHWFPDQGEEYYTFLVNGKLVITVEIPYQDNQGEEVPSLSPIVLENIQDLKHYQHNMKGFQDKLRLEMALHLSKKDSSEKPTS